MPILREVQLATFGKIVLLDEGARIYRRFRAVVGRLEFVNVKVLGFRGGADRFVGFSRGQ
jgi:hypothetical protein